MKNIGLSFLVLLSFTLVSCGKKDSGGGSSSTSALSSDSCNRASNGNIEYAEKDAKVNWGTGEITIGGQKYSPQQVSPSAISVLTSAYNSKGNVLGRTDGQINQATGRVDIIYKVRMRVALVPGGLLGGGFNGSIYNQGGVNNTANVQQGSCMLSIQTAKFRN